MQVSRHVSLERDSSGSIVLQGQVSGLSETAGPTGEADAATIARVQPATQAELTAFSRHVWRGCFVCVIYLPRSMQRCEETVEDMVRHGFPRPFLMPGVLPRPGDTVHDCVCRAHHLAVAWFLAKGLDKHFHLLCLEDDARFRFDDASERVGAALDTLERWERWQSLHIGHIAMGPIFPLGNRLAGLGPARGLVRSTVPHTSHCYVLNRRHVRSIFQRVPQHLWKRPLMVEGMWAIPADERFAMTLPVATQCVMPKEMASMPIIRDVFDFEDGEYFTTGWSLFLSLVTWAIAMALLAASVVSPPYLSAAAAERFAASDGTCGRVPMARALGLAAWTSASALVLMCAWYVTRRFTCCLAERRPWRAFGWDASRALAPALVACAAETAAARLSPPAHLDPAAHEAAVAMLFPLVAWPVALFLHTALVTGASRCACLRPLRVPGSYADPLQLQGPVSPAPLCLTQPPQPRADACAASRAPVCVRRDASGGVGAAGGVGLGGAGGPDLPTTGDTPSDTQVEEGAEDDEAGLPTRAPVRAAGGAAQEALAALEAAVAASGEDGLRPAPRARLSWWAAQTLVLATCVAVGEALAALSLQPWGQSSVVALVARAFMRTHWSCSVVQAAFCAIPRLVALALVMIALDMSLMSPEHKISPEHKFALSAALSRRSSTAYGILADDDERPFPGLATGSPMEPKDRVRTPVPQPAASSSGSLSSDGLRLGGANMEMV
mmetsp:Transcript_16457/g.50457  ORF Transcript_16457/g.50457 Transcript_16457/m.50457 type:complete len:725 (-) Transcript_16457:236-2410(-)|eukprot:CAMPEP_0185177156 /NCGR_PEP_ID=MMETSP1139-20130426/29331_1 /TAXON_ID=298111 /ORGANISM="Pavlova sp., Strain CCMP459" /LENGTH=724 /DNA_ID=CAMNT_0027742947 /DNA_START=74 /DNA_END=2248 /DNA_ORIENTATION=-